MKRLAMSVPATLDLAPGHERAAARPEVEWVTDLVARAVIVVLFSMMAIRFGTDFLSTGRMTGLLLLVSETLVVVLTVMRRSAVTVDRSTRARLLTTLSVLGPPLLQPADVAALLPQSWTVAASAVVDWRFP